ncbi:MAG: tRNA (guanosine(46)-N7)-methyltransferase TrmB [Defluviitaleaceae bacterium]|nr:tRNA (guanosine(46)-N7)-methyltransferase TrmB [Defluviitaleaceae bacterium]MCL2189771.1 tRNA (guanosine(46)-N7)-methyltransferase TrmB [Defluviitaleaceae bacterium]MCL2275403.1 tRNA (guanosine(46)-N7)-methyltransferase TrmB [Defluviitaleaceae bacterium]
MRARRKKWAPAELDSNPLIIRPTAEGAIPLRAHFNNSRPIHMEIGCGKGRFITENARRNPHINYIAIEREQAVLAAAARRGEALAQETPLSLAFLLLDVTELATRFIPEEIDRLYINFCDPWPNKKKWAKRRLTHANFLRLYTQLAIPEVHFKTDNRILFEFSLESFNAEGWKMQNISLDLHANMPEDNVVTEYEEKFSKHGPIYRLEAMPPKAMR